MNKLFKGIVTILIMIALYSCQDKGYEIKGTFEGIENGTLVKLYDTKWNPIDSTQIQDGHLKLTGTLVEPSLMRVSVGKKRYEIALENDSYLLKSDAYIDYAEGGKINEIIYGYRNFPGYLGLIKDYQDAVEAYESAGKKDTVAIQKAEQRYWDIVKLLNQLKSKYYKEVMNGSYSPLVKLFCMRYYSSENMNSQDKLNLLKSYEKEIGELNYIKVYRDKLEYQIAKEQVRESVSAGKLFKDIVATSPKGEQVELSDIVSNNKYTLFEMWASWCGPCRGEFPHLKKAYEHYHSKGFEIYAVSLDENKSAWLKALKKENVPWINVNDNKAFKSDAVEKYGVEGIPSSFLISNDGTIVASGKEVRGDNLDQMLEKLLR